MTVGETTNLMQIDTQKFMDLALYLNFVITSPLQGQLISHAVDDCLILDYNYKWFITTKNISFSTDIKWNHPHIKPDPSLRSPYLSTFSGTCSAPPRSPALPSSSSSFP